MTEHLKFALGKVVITPGAKARLSQEEIDAALTRHVCGDWGELSEDQWRQNELAVFYDDSRILSVYRAADGTKFWIVTEADRSVTKVSLSNDDKGNEHRD